MSGDQDDDDDDNNLSREKDSSQEGMILPMNQTFFVESNGNVERSII